MKYAADFRAMARNALRENWPVAILTGFVASLIGAEIATGGGSADINRNSTGEMSQEIDMIWQWEHFDTLLLVGGALLVMSVLLSIILGGPGKLGYAVFNLKLVDGKEVAFSDLFSQFHRFGEGFCMHLLVGVFTFLWSLLLVIPGIVKRYSYAMTPFILAEGRDLTANEAITASRKLMDGNKTRLFCLELSFIGWELLCIIPTVIAMMIVFSQIFDYGNSDYIPWLIPCFLPVLVGNLFLHPYQEAAYAAFYREICRETASGGIGGDIVHAEF